MADLVLHLKSKYFQQIKARTKRHEYRLCNSYWTRRLLNRRYDRLVLWDAYKPRSEATVMTFPYHGYEIRTITHEHFGPDPVKVFAIAAEPEEES
jgi:hypothetical protein